MPPRRYSALGPRGRRVRRRGPAADQACLDAFAVIGDLFTWVLGIVYTFGYLGLVILLLVENLFPPIPSEAILPLAGFLTGQGRLQFHWAVAAATAGSVLGALALYAVGYMLGEERLRELVKRYGRWLLLRESDLDRSREWFEKHGAVAVLIGRLVPFARSGISIPAGLERMPLWPFVVYTTVGSGIFNAVLIGLGWALGWQWELVQKYVEPLGWAVIAVGLGALAWFSLGRLQERQHVLQDGSRQGGQASRKGE